jgi:hypothetical protein
MRTRHGLVVALWLAGAAFAQERGLPVTYERLLNSAKEPGNWLMYGGDYKSHHYRCTAPRWRRRRSWWTA